MKKRILALFTAVALTMALVSTGAMAAGNTGFTDVPAGAWYYSYVNQASAAGLMNGNGDGTFTPDSTLTRGMFVTILGRLAQVDVSAYTETTFADVDSEIWYASYVEWAAETGIANGFDATHFAPEQAVTREQMATFIGRWLQQEQLLLPVSGNAVSAFLDANTISEYAILYVDLIRSAGILEGDENEAFNPQAFATRAQAAKVIVGMRDALEERIQYTYQDRTRYDSEDRIVSLTRIIAFGETTQPQYATTYTYDQTGALTATETIYYDRTANPLKRDWRYVNTDGTADAGYATYSADGNQRYSRYNTYSAAGTLTATVEESYTFTGSVLTGLDSWIRYSNGSSVHNVSTYDAATGNLVNNTCIRYDSAGNITD